MFYVIHLKASKQGKTILYIGFKWLFLTRLYFQVFKLVENCSTSQNHNLKQHETSSQKCRAPAKQVFTNNVHMTAFMNNLHKHVCCVWWTRPIHSTEGQLVTCSSLYEVIRTYYGQKTKFTSLYTSFLFCFHSTAICIWHNTIQKFWVGKNS